jgi:hypothetical protein
MRGVGDGDRGDRAELASERRALLERPLAMDGLWVPADVRVVGDWLHWRHVAPPCVFRMVTPGPGLLEDFVRLADAPPERIERYARRWGVLSICQHGLLSHGPDAGPADQTGLGNECRPLGWPAAPREPLEAWRHCARALQAILSLAARLGRGELGRPEDWQALFPAEPTVPWWRRSVSSEKSFLALTFTTQFLDVAQVRPVWLWSEKTPGIRLRSNGLYGALIMQVLLAISRTEGLAVCSGCGFPYAPSRQPRGDQRCYCGDCRRRKIPLRDAARAYRASRAKEKNAEAVSGSTDRKTVRLTRMPSRRRRAAS